MVVQLSEGWELEDTQKICFEFFLFALIMDTGRFLSSLPSWVMCLVSHRYFCLFVFLLILRHCFTKLTMGIYLFLHTILLSVGDPTYREKGVDSNSRGGEKRKCRCSAIGDLGLLR